MRACALINQTGPLFTTTQRRERSWALGRGRAFAVPVVYDAGCQRYFAALKSATSSGGDITLVSWSESDPHASLDADTAAGAARVSPVQVGPEFFSAL